jgi:short-subunit dehydrogenase
MLPRGQGHIINVASTAGKAGIAGSATYCASKAAVLMYTESAYAELHDRGLEFSVVLPGITRTELTSGVADMPAFRAITPESVAEAITAAVIKPRFEVWVPSSARTLMNVTRLMPFAIAQRIAKKMGADHIFMDAVERPERAAYEARATGREER